MHAKSRQCIANLIIAIAILMNAACASAFETQDVSFKNPADGINLGATLTIPEGNSTPRAALVLVTGSGAQNRDEEIMGHRPFRAIAESLSDQGFAVLRYDDRGVGDSDTGKPGPTTEDFATDAAAALSWLNERYDGKVACGILGHSEGGSIAIMQAQNPECKFIITLGAPAFRGDSIILQQAHTSMREAGTENQWSTVYPTLRARYDLLMGPTPQLFIEPLLMEDVARSQPGILDIPGMKERLMPQIKAMASPWYRYFLRYDPASDIGAVTIPWLAIGGEKDTQVPPENLHRITELNPSATCIELPGHNHLMLPCITGSVAEYPTLSGDISPQTISTILNWLTERF